MKPDSLIFDLDGTLWDSTEGILATWALILKDRPEIHKVVTREDMESNFGRPIYEIGARLFPDQSEEVVRSLMDECNRRENDYLAEHGALLYPHLEETLKTLSEHIPLFIVSNCQIGYIESFFKSHHTDVYFKDHESMGATGLSKGENIRLVMERNGLKHPAYMGDTQGDADAAAFAGIPFIYARYGFGQVDHFDLAVDHFEELLQLID